MRLLSGFCRVFLFCAVCAVGFSSSALAVDWIYDTEAAGTAETLWSQTLGASDADGLWYYMDGDSRVYMRGGYSAGDTFTVNSFEGSGTTTIKMDTSVELGGLTLNSYDVTSRVSISSASLDYGIKVNGDMNVLQQVNGAAVVPLYNGLSLEVADNLNVSAIYFEPVTRGFKVGGDIISKNANEMNCFGGYTGSGSFENPDINVAGAVRNFQRFCLRNDYSAQNLYYQFGGFDNVREFRIYNSAVVDGRMFITLTNASGADYWSPGNLNETYKLYGNDYLIAVNPQERSRVVLIMKGADSTSGQTFRGDVLAMSGGMQVDSGKLGVNFNQTASSYTFQASYDKDGSGAKTYNVTYWTDNLGSVQTTFSHGDLVMNGGVFGGYINDDSYGAFRFGDIVYSGGTIALRLSSAGCDTLDLTSYYQKEELVGDSSAVYWTKEGGGTVKFADGVAEGTKVTFDFGNDLAWLIDSSLNDGAGYKVIAWDSDNKTALSSGDFVANNFVLDDATYTALFEVGNDGLYVKYVVVPEPGEVACIVGAAALLAAFFRRRRA